MTQPEKVVDLTFAIKLFVPHNAHISIGGFTINRNPMAAAYEIIRQGIKGLHVYAHSNGQGVDELVGAGCVTRLEIAYAGSGRFAPTCVRFRKAVENRCLDVEDYSNYQMTLRFLAGAMGIPFMPTRSGLGSSIVESWGFDASTRASDYKLPDQNQIPSFCVDAVVPIPLGAYPTACFHHYDYDPIYLYEYREAAQDDERYTTYLQKYILDVENHKALLNLIDPKQLASIKADIRTVYAVGLDRR